MNFRAQLAKPVTKGQVEEIVRWLGADPARLAELAGFFAGEQRVPQYAAWVLSCYTDLYPENMMPYIPLLVAKLQQATVGDGLKRNVLRMLQSVPLPESVHGPVMNICFDYLANNREAIAVRVFAMSVLADLSLVYPEIRNELKLMVEDLSRADASPGLKSRSRKVLQQLGSTGRH